MTAILTSLPVTPRLAIVKFKVAKGLQHRLLIARWIQRESG